MRRCRFIRANGDQCRGNALNHGDCCYFHTEARRDAARQRARARNLSGPHSNTTCTGAAHDHGAALIPSAPGFPTPLSLELPLIDGLCSVQIATSRVLQAIANNSIEPKRASLLLYALQIAQSNAAFRHSHDHFGSNTVHSAIYLPDGTALAGLKPPSTRLPDDLADDADDDEDIKEDEENQDEEEEDDDDQDDEDEEEEEDADEEEDGEDEEDDVDDEDDEDSDDVDDEDEDEDGEDEEDDVDDEDDEDDEDSDDEEEDYDDEDDQDEDDARRPAPRHISSSAAPALPSGQPERDADFDPARFPGNLFLPADTPDDRFYAILFELHKQYVK